MQGFNPNYNALLQSGAQQAQALGQLGQMGGALIAQNRQQNQLAAQQQEISDAISSGDIGQVAQVSMKYPELSKSIRDSFQFQSDATEDNFKKTNFNIIADPANTEQYLTERVNFLESMGMDATKPKSRLEMYRQDPERFIETTKGLTVAAYPEEYQAYQKSMTEGKGAPQYSNVQFDEAGNPYGLNKNTGQYEPIQGGFVKGEAKPQTVVNVGKAEGEQAKTIAKAEGENYNQYVKDAKSARQNDITLNQLEKLNESAFSGVAAPAYKSAAKLAKSIGIDVEGLTETELFDSLSNQLVLGQTSKLTGVLTDKDMDLLASTVPQLSQTKEGRKKLIQIMKEVNVATREKAKLAAQFRKENNGQFDDMAFQEWLEGKPKKDRFTSIIGDQQPQRVQAPQSAIDYLMANPNLKESFKAKYGYLPEGM